MCYILEKHPGLPGFIKDQWAHVDVFLENTREEERRGEKTSEEEEEEEEEERMRKAE